MITVTLIFALLVVLLITRLPAIVRAIRLKQQQTRAQEHQDAQDQLKAQWIAKMNILIEALWIASDPRDVDSVYQQIDLHKANKPWEDK